MAFLAILLLAGGTLLAFASITGRAPSGVLAAVLRGEEMPEPRYVIEQQAPDTGSGGGEGSGSFYGGVGSFARPLYGWNVTSGYGMRSGRMHEGVDVPAATGTPIRAAAAGTVDKSGWSPGAGNRVNVKHDSTYTTKYFHMSRTAAKVGDRVSQGQVIGYVGSTGDSSGPHLHFEVWKNGRSQNPTGYVR